MSALEIVATVAVVVAVFVWAECGQGGFFNSPTIRVPSKRKRRS